MEQKIYNKLFDYAINSCIFFQIKYLFNANYIITYYPAIKGIEIFNSKINSCGRYYENVNKSAISDFSAHLINLLLLTKVYYESQVIKNSRKK